ncbi:MAG: sulfur carrier protein ThiS [Blastocatellales bacterium]
MEISVNGEPRQITKEASVTDLVASLELTAARLAIELNLSILPRNSWATTKLQNGDKLEIVHFVGGG